MGNHEIERILKKDSPEYYKSKYKYFYQIKKII